MKREAMMDMNNGIDDLYWRIRSIVGADVDHTKWPCKTVRKNKKGGNTNYYWACQDDHDPRFTQCINLYTSDRHNDHSDAVNYRGIYRVRCSHTDSCTADPVFRASVSLWTAFARGQPITDVGKYHTYGLYVDMCPVCWTVDTFPSHPRPMCYDANCQLLIEYFLKAARALWGIKREVNKDVWAYIATLMVNVSLAMLSACSTQA